MNGSAGTQGWYSCEPLSKRRVGKPGPNPEKPFEDSPLYYALKLRTAGKHNGYLSVWEWSEERGSWMLLVLDVERNVVGQTMGRTIAAATRRMNALFAAKGLGIYERKYADPDTLAEAEAQAAGEADETEDDADDGAGQHDRGA